MTLENPPIFNRKIHLQMEDVPLSIWVFRGKKNWNHKPPKTLDRLTVDSNHQRNHIKPSPSSRGEWAQHPPNRTRIPTCRLMKPEVEWRETNEAPFFFNGQKRIWMYGTSPLKKNKSQDLTWKTLKWKIHLFFWYRFFWGCHCQMVVFQRTSRRFQCCGIVVCEMEVSDLRNPWKRGTWMTKFGCLRMPLGARIKIQVWSLDLWWHSPIWQSWKSGNIDNWCHVATFSRHWYLGL